MVSLKLDLSLDQNIGGNYRKDYNDAFDQKRKLYYFCRFLYAVTEPGFFY